MHPGGNKNAKKIKISNEVSVQFLLTYIVDIRIEKAVDIHSSSFM
jgi:hypothetical protein